MHNDDPPATVAATAATNDADADTGQPRKPNRRSFIGGAAAGALAGAGGLAAAVTVPAFASSPATSAPPDPGPGDRFAGKVVLITGATSGIGEAAARAFAREGAKVAFCGRRTELGRQVERDIRADGGQATYIRADVREPEQLKHFVDEVVRVYGRLDIAFNNAGITRTGPLHELSLELWEDVQRTNARGVFLAIKYEVLHLLRTGGGVIICTASESVRPGGTAYTASKHAIQGIVKTAALDYGTQGIRVNAISPGTTDTGLVRPSGIPDPVWAAFKNAWGPLNVNGLERMAEPEEIARAVLSLATDDFSYMAGSNVLVGGGPLSGGKMRMPPGFPART